MLLIIKSGINGPRIVNSGIKKNALNRTNEIFLVFITYNYLKYTLQISGWLFLALSNVVLLNV